MVATYKLQASNHGKLPVFYSLGSDLQADDIFLAEWMVSRV
jgi:hypothetical protein